MALGHIGDRGYEIGDRGNARGCEKKRVSE